MKNFLKILTISVMAVMSFSIVASGAATAQLNKQICEGIGATGANCSTSNAKTTVDNLVADIINIFSWIVGVVSVLMVIFGGFKYITSGGDSGKVSSAKNTIMYAIIGLVIVALAQMIVIFVLDQVS